MGRPRTQTAPVLTALFVLIDASKVCRYAVPIQQDRLPEASMKTNLPVTNVETRLPEGAFIYSRTDLKGVIVEVNEVFA